MTWSSSSPADAVCVDAGVISIQTVARSAVTMMPSAIARYVGNSRPIWGYRPTARLSESNMTLPNYLHVFEAVQAHHYLWCDRLACREGAA